MTETLASSVVTVFRSLYDMDVYSRKYIRVMQQIYVRIFEKCSKYVFSLGARPILFLLYFYDLREIPRYKMQLFVIPEIVHHIVYIN